MSRTIFSKTISYMYIKNKVNILNKPEYYMYGTHAVLAAMNNPIRHIKKIYCLPKFAQEHKNILKRHIVEIVSNDFIIKKIGSNQPHQGVIALVDSIFKDNIN